DSRVPASESRRDFHSEIVTAGSRSDGGVAALLVSSRASHSAPVAIEGRISPDVDGKPTFNPIRQEGSVITFEHPDEHDLTGAVPGRWEEVGLLTLDVSTGQGFVRAEGVFTGTVLGRGPGTAILRIQGEVRDFFVITAGHFVITQGEGGLAGVHAS